MIYNKTYYNYSEYCTPLTPCSLHWVCSPVLNLETKSGVRQLENLSSLQWTLGHLWVSLSSGLGTGVPRTLDRFLSRIISISTLTDHFHTKRDLRLFSPNVRPPRREGPIVPFLIGPPPQGPSPRVMSFVVPETSTVWPTDSWKKKMILTFGIRK